MAFNIDSQTDIANLALDHLGQTPVNSITTPKTKVEELCARWYEQTRRFLLEHYDWNFAIKRAILAPLSEEVPFGYETQYELPEDLLNLLSVGEDYYYDHPNTYTVEGNRLLTRKLNGANYAPIQDNQLPIRYVENFTNVAGMTASFIQAFALLYAANLAQPLTNSSSKIQQLEARFVVVVKMAKINDAVRSPIKRVNRYRSYLDHQGDGDRVHGSEYGGYLWLG